MTGQCILTNIERVLYLIYMQVSRRETLHIEEMGMRNKYNMTEADFSKLRRNVERTVSYYAGIQWKFSGSFYFALTVVTAIGKLISLDNVMSYWFLVIMVIKYFIKL